MKDVAEQLAECMRENERLREALTKVMAAVSDPETFTPITDQVFVMANELLWNKDSR